MMGRRQLLRASVLGGTALLPWRRTSQAKTFDDGSSDVIASSATPVVETMAGRVRGYIRNGIHCFKGIPYAAGTGGAARFAPPGPAKPWSGVRASLTYGPVCPQPLRQDRAFESLAFMFDWDDGYPSEDCLRLNIWTPLPDDGSKRPVMVWIHGGWFQAGSSQELPAYDGENLTRRGDVVVVSVNHRLGALGYLDLSAIGGERYRTSANAGMLDLVAALQWVRDNIAGFGGDPANVTLFGQSGGGYKIGTLMAMPAARGLLHKAIVQSGSRPRIAERADGERIARAVLQEIGIDQAGLSAIHDVAPARLIEAGARALQKLTAGQPADVADRLRWQPVVDGDVIPAQPFDPASMRLSGDVPLMVGTTMHEWNPGIVDAGVLGWTLDEVSRRLAPRFGDRVGAILEAYRQANPQARPFELFALIISARTDAVEQAERKATLGAAAVYVYWFGWRSPLFDGRLLAFHCLDLPFVFANTDRCAMMTGGGAGARSLAATVSEAWIAFARTGDPNHAGLPAWPRFDPVPGPTMIFDDQCQLRNDPDRAERRSLAG